MIKLNIGLFLLSLPAFLIQGAQLESLPEEARRDLQSHGFNEQLGACHGATCGLWGDPHIVTCDGKGYDCQAIGVVNLMNNSMYEIQGQFVDVGAREHGMIRNWGMTEGASLTNAVAVKFKQNVTDGTIPPIFQVGFGALDLHDEDFRHPRERGCTEYQYYRPTNMPGQGRSVEPTLEDCHDRCRDIDGCTKFSWWADGGCHMNSASQHTRSSPRNWPRSLSGPETECGIGPPPEDQLQFLDPAEQRFHGSVRAQCPLLFHVDGDLVDISDVGRNGYLYGEAGDPVTLRIINNWILVLEYKITDEETSEEYTASIHILIKGHGPGELWSCHFDFYVCLPQSQQEDFMVNTIGLLGTPNGDRNDEFMDSEGNQVDMPTHPSQEQLINYCLDNHCVDQSHNLIMPHPDQTFDDIKCEHVEYTNFTIDNVNCVINSTQILTACAEMPPLMVHSCHLDCCLGGCDQVEESRDALTGDDGAFHELSTDPDDVMTRFDPPPANPACDEETGLLESTSESVCPSADDDVVRIIGDSDEPPGDVFFGIEMDSGNDEIGRTVKFRVNNPFDEPADVFVKYGKSVMGHSFIDPKCDDFTEQPTGCNESATIVEVACHDYDNISPFALVHVYFASTAVSGSATIDNCCNPPTYTEDVGVVMYSFEVQCACPANNGVAVEG